MFNKLTELMNNSGIATLTPGQVFFALFQRFSWNASWNFTEDIGRESLDRESLSLYKYILSSHVQILFGNIIIVEKVLKTISLYFEEGEWLMRGGSGARDQFQIKMKLCLNILSPQKNSKYCFHQKR